MAIDVQKQSWHTLFWTIDQIAHKAVNGHGEFSSKMALTYVIQYQLTAFDPWFEGLRFGPTAPIEKLLLFSGRRVWYVSGT